MTNQQNIGNDLTKEVPPSQRVYAFKDLPANVQENLLRLQNTDGDFLKTGEKRIVLANIIILFLILNVFFGFVSAFSFSKINAPQIGLFAVCCGLFGYWIAYFGRKVYRTFALPVKNHVYLTRTQLIKIIDGAVEYRELKDVVEIKLDKVSNKSASGGWDYILTLKSDDGDFCEYAFPRWWTEHRAEAEQWREKAIVWRDEAVSAEKRGDADFFAAHDIISISATADLPIFEESSRFLFVSPRLMFKITLLLLTVFLLVEVLVKFL